MKHQTLVRINFEFQTVIKGYDKWDNVMKLCRYLTAPLGLPKIDLNCSHFTGPRQQHTRLTDSNIK